MTKKLVNQSYEDAESSEEQVAQTYCMSCGKGQPHTKENTYRDELGPHTVCKHCGASYDVSEPLENLSMEDICRRHSSFEKLCKALDSTLYWTNGLGSADHATNESYLKLVRLTAVQLWNVYQQSQENQENNHTPFHCPMCETDAPMELKEIPTEKPNGRENKTYIWICGVCPCVILEYWDDQDKKNFNQTIG